MRKLKLVCAAAALALTLGAAPAMAAQYVLTDLGTLPGGSWSYASAINNAGQVVGIAADASGRNHGFVWSASSGMNDIAMFPGGDYTHANAINNLGAVTGLADVNNFTHAFRWTSADGLTDLGSGAVERSAGLGINDAGLIVGEVRRPPVGGSSVGDQAVLWSADGVATDLGDLMGGLGQSHAHDINNSGVVTGWSTIAGGASAFIWTSATGMQSIGDLPGASHISYGQAINESSQVVGYGYGQFGYRAFLWSAADGMLDLGTPAGGSSQVLGNALNDAAEVVGNFADTDYEQSAFYWSSGTGMLDLNSVVDTAGWRLIEATGINNRGQIVGWMRQGQNDHAFVLTPVTGGVPEPGTWMLLIAGFGGAGAALRRRTSRTESQA